ncbi:MAG TPA: hypothetical protein VG650_12300 [Mycobacteriales bacterium]|nr:hypothetical protein [Mycobacteriales bacterium]
MSGDDFGFDQLLRGRGDELDAPTGAWSVIARRARRRKRVKGLLAAAAGVAVVAGAAPAIIAVRGSSDDQRLQVTASPPHSNPTTALGDGQSNPVVHPSLDRLIPTSLSFVTQSEGWVSGALRVRGGTVAGGLARTVNAGSGWSIVTANPAPQGEVRFADSKQGLSFGETYQVTNDGGLTWQSEPSPGFITDLETAHGVVWALVRSCGHCDGLRLFQATLTDPTLVRVAAVKPIGNLDAAITLRDHAIYVTGGHDMWASVNDGYSWRHRDNPCGSGNQSFAAWSERGLAAECTPANGVGSLFESLDAGRHWTNIANVPRVQAGVGTLSAGSPDELLITTGSGAPFVSHHHGHHWARAGVPGAVTFAAYISSSHIVGITADHVPAFVTSFDSGRTWTETALRSAVVP